MSTRLELVLYFLIGLFFTFLMPPLFPSLKLYYFFPLLIRCFYLKPLNSCLFYSLAIGLIIDLLSAHHRFGLYSATYAITTYFLYRLKRNFFEDNFTTLPFMTFFFSSFSSIIYFALIGLLDSQAIPLSLSFILIEFLFLPLFDALFALLVFAIPEFFFKKPSKKGSDYFLHREDS